MQTWDVNFLKNGNHAADRPHALIILNQPFSLPLLERLWNSTQWHCCADGGANRLFDVFSLEESAGRDADEARLRRVVPVIGPCGFVTGICRYLPDLIKGDFDSLRPDVRNFYASHGVAVVQDHDQDSTDLMKCFQSLEEKEREGNSKVRPLSDLSQQYLTRGITAIRHCPFGWISRPTRSNDTHTLLFAQASKVSPKSICRYGRQCRMGSRQWGTRPSDRP